MSVVFILKKNYCLAHWTTHLITSEYCNDCFRRREDRHAVVPEHKILLHSLKFAVRFFVSFLFFSKRGRDGGGGWGQRDWRWGAWMAVVGIYARTLKLSFFFFFFFFCRSAHCLFSGIITKLFLKTRASPTTCGGSFYIVTWNRFVEWWTGKFITESFYRDVL